METKKSGVTEKILIQQSSNLLFECFWVVSLRFSYNSRPLIVFRGEMESNSVPKDIKGKNNHHNFQDRETMVLILQFFIKLFTHTDGGIFMTNYLVDRSFIHGLGLKNERLCFSVSKLLVQASRYNSSCSGVWHDMYFCSVFSYPPLIITCLLLDQESNLLNEKRMLERKFSELRLVCLSDAPTSIY